MPGRMNAFLEPAGWASPWTIRVTVVITTLCPAIRLFLVNGACLAGVGPVEVPAEAELGGVLFELGADEVAGDPQRPGAVELPVMAADTGRAAAAPDPDARVVHQGVQAAPLVAHDLVGGAPAVAGYPLAVDEQDALGELALQQLFGDQVAAHQAAVTAAGARDLPKPA